MLYFWLAIRIRKYDKYDTDEFVPDNVRDKKDADFDRFGVSQSVIGLRTKLNLNNNLTS